MIRSIMILLLFLTATVLAQDEVSEEGAASEVSESENQSADDGSDEALDDELEDDILSGNQDHTEDDEDIFVPTEEISFQQSIPFPTDI